MKTYLLCFLTIIYSLPCFARQDSIDYYIRHYTDENGLPQNSVKAIAPDEYGFVWMSTEDGLVRFDGAKFISFGVEQLKISSPRFRTFFRSANNKSLYCFTHNDERIIIENGLPRYDSLNKSAADKNVFFPSIVDHLKKTYAMEGLPPSGPRWGELMESLTFHIGASANYTYRHDSIFYNDATHRQYQIIFKTSEKQNFFTIGSELYHLKSNGILTHFSEKGAETTLLQGDILTNHSYQSKQAPVKIFWNLCMPDFVLLYLDQTFYIAKTDKNRNLYTRTIFAQVPAMLGDMISAYYNETDGILYLGSYTKGLYILNRKSFTTLTTPFGENIYYGQANYGKNGILTAQGNFFSSSGESKKIEAIHSRVPYDFYSIVIDKQNNTWLKRDDWLYKLSAGTFRQLGAWRLPTGIALLNEGNHGNVWIALRGRDIYTIDINSDTATPHLFTTLPEPVTYIWQDKQTLYVGTIKNMYRIALPAKTAIPVPGLNNKYINCIYTAPDGNIWVTTNGHGIFLLRKDHLYSFPLDAHNFLATAHCVVEDKKGFLWISTNKGLFQISKADLLRFANGRQEKLYYQYHDKYEGFNTNEFNGNCEPCGITLDNGKISFPSLNGLVTFDPDSVTAPLPDAPLFIDKTELDKQEINITALQQLPRHFDQLKFYISTPFMGNRENLHIEYALVKNDANPLWLPVSDDGLIAFNTLPSGDFDLLIRKQQGFGNNNFVEKKIHLTIVKAWFETTWFYIACMALLGLSVWLFIRMRIRLVQKRNNELEQMVAIKTGELERQTKIQNMIIRSVSHDVQTPLQYQALLSQTIYEGLLQQKYDAITEPARVLNDGTIQLQHMISNLLKYLKTQMENTSDSKPENVNIYELVAEKVTIFKSISQRKGTVIHNNIQPSLQVRTDAQIMSVIIHNLLDNAVKATKNGTISIDAKMAGEKHQIIIQDTGYGLPLHLQQWINNTTEQNSAFIPEQERPAGIGLIMVKELTALQGVEISVSAGPSGTCFTLYIK